MVKVGIIQMQSDPLAVEKNLSLAESLVNKVVSEGAQIVVLPEVFNVGFYFGEDLMAVAEKLDGRTVEVYHGGGDQVARVHGAVIETHLGLALGVRGAGPQAGEGAFEGEAHPVCCVAGEGVGVLIGRPIATVVPVSPVGGTVDTGGVFVVYLGGWFGRV